MVPSDGYAASVTLVTATGSRRTHFRAEVADHAWLMLLPPGELWRYPSDLYDLSEAERARVYRDAEQAEERTYERGYKSRAALTVCGKAVAGYERGAAQHQQCGACLRGAGDALRAQVAILAARWPERWRAMPREAALASYLERLGAPAGGPT